MLAVVLFAALVVLLVCAFAADEMRRRHKRRDQDQHARGFCEPAVYGETVAALGFDPLEEDG